MNRNIAQQKFWPKTEFDNFGNTFKVLKSGHRIKVFNQKRKELYHKACLEQDKCVVTSINYLPNKAIWRAKKDQVIRNTVFREDISKCYSDYQLIHDECQDSRIHLITMYVPICPVKDHETVLVPPSQNIIEEDPIEPEFFDDDFKFISDGNNKFF